MVARGDHDDGVSRARPRPRSRHFVWQWIAGFLVILLGAELGVRALANHLPEPLDYFSGQAQTVVHDMNVLRQHGIRSDLTFIGTSMVRRDIDANKFESVIPDVHWAHNVALPGTQTPVMQRWLLEEVLPRIHPKRVVWGVSSLDFNGGRDQAITRYDTARATERGLLGELDRLMGISALSENRTALRDPYQWDRVMSGHAVTYSHPRPLGDRAVWTLGYNRLSAARLARMRATHLAYVKQHQLVNFRVGQAALDAFRSTLATLHRDGIEVAVVVMPVPTGYLAAHPGGAAQYEAWKQLITQTATGESAQVIDDSRAMPDSAFRDYEHLLVAPAREFSLTLAQRLAAMGW